MKTEIVHEHPYPIEDHAEAAKAAEADVRRAYVCRSTGSDGYTPGTWGWLVIDGGWTSAVTVSSDGGFPSREAAIIGVCLLEGVR
jgi:hypothetical protein